MDALNNVEQSYQKLLRAQTNSKQESTSTKTNSSLSVSVSFLFCVCPIILNVLLQVQFKNTQLSTNYFHCNCLNLHCDTLFFIFSLPILVSLKNKLQFPYSVWKYVLTYLRKWFRFYTITNKHKHFNESTRKLWKQP